MTPEEILEKEGIRDYEKDIRRMSARELTLNFSATSSGRPMAALIIKNLIWQSYTGILSGKLPPFEGNLRSYWYYIKPVLARIKLTEDFDHYQTMLKAFVELVGDYKLFGYMDFGFDDDSWENRRIGVKNAQVIVFAEKVGWMRTLKEIHQTYDVTVIALGGAPSLLTTEYTVAHIRKATSLRQPFYLLSAVDYDPAGYSIARSFGEQLATQGIEQYELTDLILPAHYTPEEIELFKFPIPARQKTKLEKWLKATGGIHGEPYGLEGNSMPRDRYKALLKAALAGLGVRPA